jgi:hypothetical protein
MKDTAALGSLPRAERLAQKIKQYWAAKGHTVETYIVAEIQEVGQDRGNPLYGVRTNLVNGVPK